MGARDFRIGHRAAGTRSFDVHLAARLDFDGSRVAPGRITTTAIATAHGTATTVIGAGIPAAAAISAAARHRHGRLRLLGGSTNAHHASQGQCPDHAQHSTTIHDPSPNFMILKSAARTLRAARSRPLDREGDDDPKTRTVIRSPGIRIDRNRMRSGTQAHGEPNTVAKRTTIDDLDAGANSDQKPGIA